MCAVGVRRKAQSRWASIVLKLDSLHEATYGERNPV